MPQDPFLTPRFNLAVKLAGNAGELLLEHRQQNRNPERLAKIGKDFATMADLRAEKLIVEGIRENFPTDHILAEESAPDITDPERMIYSNKEALWIIDPLDGTFNYAAGDDNFAVAIAFVQKGVTAFGVVCVPTRGAIFGTVPGTGEPEYVVVADGRKVLLHYPPGKLIKRDMEGFGFGHPHVSPVTSSREAIVLMNFPTDPRKRQEMYDIFGKLIHGDFLAFQSRASAVADSLSIADGRFHAFIQVGLKPWDIAAAAKIVEMAGGRATRLNGDPWSPFYDDLVVSNGHIHDHLLKLLNG